MEPDVIQKNKFLGSTTLSSGGHVWECKRIWVRLFLKPVADCGLSTSVMTDTSICN